MKTVESGICLGLIMLLLGLSACVPIFPPLENQGDAAQAESYGAVSFASRLRARQAKAEALMAQSELTAALTEWKILQALDPDNPTFKQQRWATQALIEKRVRNHLQAGKKAFDQGKDVKARQAFLRVLALDPSQTQPHMYLRKIEQRHLKGLQRSKLARVQANATKARGMDNHAAQEGRDHLKRGVQHFHQKEFKASIDALRAHLADYPKSHEARRFLAAAHFQLGRQLHREGYLTEALGHYLLAREIQPDGAPRIDQYIGEVQRALSP